MQSPCGAKRQHYFELNCLYHSHPSAVKLRTWICFTGWTYLSSGTYVTVDTNANKLLRLECVMSAVPRITWWNSPGLLSQFLHIASNQIWRHKRPGNEANKNQKLTNRSWVTFNVPTQDQQQDNHFKYCPPEARGDTETRAGGNMIDYGMGWGMWLTSDTELEHDW